MQVEPLVPDVAVPHGPLVRAGDAPLPQSGEGAFARLVDAAGAILGGADRAESAFVAHSGGLQEMVVERARADIALQVAASAAQRATQALTTLLGMQL